MTVRLLRTKRLVEDLVMSKVTEDDNFLYLLTVLPENPQCLMLLTSEALPGKVWMPIATISN